MKRIFAIFLAVIIMALLLVGCGKTGDDASVTGRFRVVEFHKNFFSQFELIEVIFVDTETNVLYMLARSGHGGGLTPLLDSNGNVQFLDE